MIVTVVFVGVLVVFFGRASTAYAIYHAENERSGELRFR
jgi:hypothetical protein